jgi:hypothetical protein
MHLRKVCGSAPATHQPEQGGPGVLVSSASPEVELSSSPSPILEAFDERFAMTIGNPLKLHESQRLNLAGDLDAEGISTHSATEADDALPQKLYVVHDTPGPGQGEDGDGVSAGRARCGLFQKLFRGPEFVLKHLR